MTEERGNRLVDAMDAATAPILAAIDEGLHSVRHDLHPQRTVGELLEDLADLNAELDEAYADLRRIRREGVALNRAHEAAMAETLCRLANGIRRLEAGRADLLRRIDARETED